MDNSKFYITTAIDYVNAPPHLGHALEKVQADVLARYQRLLGKDTFFLSGTDENSLKNVRAAQKEGISVEELVDRNAQKFYQLKEALNLSFDHFIRTTEKRHIKGAQKLWSLCKKDIYKKKYQGLYCVGCEEFYKESELENGLCPDHKTEPEFIEEENYFFKLSRYSKTLQKLIEANKLEIIPPTRKREVLSFISQGLEDICISRSAKRAKGWGIDVPQDKSQKIWVWFDALSSYLNAIGYPEDQKRFQEWWQRNENITHVIGKSVLRFHAIYWPAFLLSAGLKLPKIIFVHGNITSGGQKMSKSLGNVINPLELVEKYSSVISSQAATDSIRYFLLREIPSIEDGDFTYPKFEKRYNSDLAKGLGNLVARVVTVAKEVEVQKNISDQPFFNQGIEKIIEATKNKYQKGLRNFHFNKSLKAIWELISWADQYIEKKRPWEGDKEAIGDLLLTLKEIADLLKPFLPQTSEKVLNQIDTFKKKSLFPQI